MSHPAHDNPFDLPSGRLPLPAWFRETAPAPARRLPGRIPVDRLLARPDHRPPVGSRVTVPKPQTAAPQGTERGVHRAKLAPEGWRTYYAVDSAGYLVLRLDLREGRNTDPRVVRAWLLAILNLLDPDGAPPVLSLSP